jgi:murein L,D-transpeptidase YafK
MGILFRAALVAWLSMGVTTASAEDIRMSDADVGRQGSLLDQLVAAAIQDLRASKTDSALASVERLIAMRPDFKLAHLLKADLLQIKAGTLSSFGQGSKRSTQHTELDGLKDEARVRLMRYLDQPDPDKLPKQILQLAPGQRYALLADASRARLYLFENQNGEPRLIRDFYVTVGRNGVHKKVEGDLKTPTGVYTVTSKLSPKQLTPFYGAGAFPLDYPNEWDVKQGNTGHGIWLHGVPPDTYSRPPKASEGCLVVANPDYQELNQYIQPGNTPVVIAERTDWLDRDEWLKARRDIMSAVIAWKTAWQKQDVDRYLDFYSQDFLKRAGSGWVAKKRQNILQKNWIRIGLSDINLFLYPGNDLAVMNFTQDYDSDKHRDLTRKRFYLKQDNGEWRIALESSLQSAPSLASNN